MHEPMIIKYHVLEGGVAPTKSRDEDIGFDLTARSVCKEDRGAAPLCTFMIDFGVLIEPSEGCYVELIPRSSLSWTGFIMPNSVGVIDPNYRGIIMMPLIYLGPHQGAERAAEALIGRRLAQLVIRRRESVKMIEVHPSELSTTSRGELGFGSSGQ